MTSPESSKNCKRRFERTRHLTLVAYRPVDYAKGDLGEFDETMTASSVDLSAGGMMLRMTETFKPKTLLELRFRLAADQAEMNVLSSVVRCTPAEYQGVYYVSVEYPMLSDADRALIDRFVKETNKRRA